MIHVSEENPRDLDPQFFELYPLLGMKGTANSGAFHGDGDGRPAAKQVDLPTFAMESKARFRGRQSDKLTPTPAEWEKAMDDKTGQLRRFDRTAYRLFLVYSRPLGEWAVSVPVSDLAKMQTEAGMPLPQGEARTMRRKGVKIAYRFFDEWAFNALYEAFFSALEDHAFYSSEHFNDVIDRHS